MMGKRSYTVRVFRFVGVAILIPIVGYLGYGCWLLITEAVLSARAEHRVLYGNHVQLLAACRDLIANRGEYAKRVGPDVVRNRHGEVVINEWDVSNPNKYRTDGRIPAPVRELRPLYIVIGRGYCDIYLRYPARSHVVAHSEGTAARLPESRSERVMLTKDLWYYHDSPQTNASRSAGE